MDNELYFIPIIEQALQSSNPKQSLTDTLNEIKELGHKEEYGIGLQQFKYFMGQSVESIQYPGIQLNEKWFLHDRDTQANKDIKIHPIQPSAFLSIELVKDDQRIEQISINKIPCVIEFSRIESGNYLLRLNTGRILWAGTLDYKHLQWAKAFTDKPLPAAAQTDKTQSYTTVDEWLLDEDIRFQVIPGIESGKIKIEIQQSTRKS
jgi:hypothetical protein